MNFSEKQTWLEHPAVVLVHMEKATSDYQPSEPMKIQ